MAPQRRANCQICKERESKYACPACEVLYCSVLCYKQHKSYSCSASASASTSESINTSASANAEGITSTDSANTSILTLSSSASVVATTTSAAMRGTIGGGSPQAVVVDVDTDIKTRLESGGDDDSEQGSSGVITTKATTTRERQPSLSSDWNESMKGGGVPQVRQGGGRIYSGGDSARTHSGSSSSNANSNLVGRVMEAEARLSDVQSQLPAPGSQETPPPQPATLRALTTLKWPYVPDPPSYADPLSRDDPKPLTLPQYEAIARSPRIRRLLSSPPSSHPTSSLANNPAPRLRTLLQEIDKLRGDARERAIERVLGVAPEQSSVFSISGLPSSSSVSSSRSDSHWTAQQGGGGFVVDGEDMRALRELAEAVEAAVRSAAVSDSDATAQFGADAQRPLGLDWAD